MIRFAFGFALLVLVGNASGEECTARTESELVDGKPYSWETCVARVDDVVKTKVDGHVMIHYIVQYKSQRLVVSDPLVRTDHVVGEQVSFMVGRLPMPANSRSLVSGSLYAIVND